MRPAASPLATWAGIVVLYVVWGSTYLGIKVAVDSIPPFVMGFLRFVPAGLILAGAVALRHRGAIRRPSRREVVDTTIVGGLLLLGGMGLVAWGERTVSSGISALMIALMPMWLAIFSRLFVGERLPAMALAGIVVGLGGVAILAWPAGGEAQLDPGGLVALLVSPMCWSIGSLYSARRAVLPAPALFATGLQMIAGGFVLLAAALLSGEVGAWVPAAVSLESWLGLGYLLVVGSLVGYTTYAWLLTVAPLPRIATYAYVNPVVAVVLGALILHEPLGPRTLVAGVVIVAAVVLIVTARARAASTAVAPPRREPVPIPLPVEARNP